MPRLEEAHRTHRFCQDRVRRVEVITNSDAGVSMQLLPSDEDNAVVGVTSCRKLCQRTLEMSILWTRRRRRVDEDVDEDHVDVDLGD